MRPGEPKPSAEQTTTIVPPPERHDDGGNDAPFAVDDDPAYANDATAGLDPTADDPLRGCPLLSKIAIVGRERILEMAERPIDYVWQDIAVRGTVVLLAGGPSCGKTTLLFLILAARLNRREPIDLLGRIVTPMLRDKWIVIIEAEHGEISSARKIKRSCDTLAIHDVALERVILVARKAVRIGSPEWEEVAKLVATGLVTDIALDTIARVSPSDGNSEQEQVKIFDLVAQTIERAPSEAHKPTVWAVGHTRKNNQTGGPEDVLGSTQRAGQSDSVAIVRAEKTDGRTVASGVTWVKLREEPELYPLPVVFSILVDLENGSRKLIVHGMSEDKDLPLEEQITRQLETGPRTKGALKAKLGRSDKDVQAAIDNLFSAGRLTTEYLPIKGVNRKHFALRKGVANGA
jgi:hypothetical protein